MSMPLTGNTVLTIGHSTHPLEDFIDLLRRHRVTALADVRSTPYSRYNPQFNQLVLKRRLKGESIAYVFLGAELGGRSDNPTFYRDGHINYDRLGRTDAFQYGLGRVTRGAADYRIALMCAEKEPLHCHRSLLVAPALVARGVKVAHILADGTLESHEDTMKRLLAEPDPDDATNPWLIPPDRPDRPHAERIREAIAIQAAEFGHQWEEPAHSPTQNEGDRSRSQP